MIVDINGRVDYTEFGSQIEEASIKNLSKEVYFHKAISIDQDFVGKIIRE